jgi:hypothetical protein
VERLPFRFRDLNGPMILLSNSIRTLPAAWAIMLGVEFATMGLVKWSHPNQDWNSSLANVIFFFLSPAWIGPPSEKNVWLISAATLVLLVPFFFASYGIEYLVIKFVVGMPEGGPPNLA